MLSTILFCSEMVWLTDEFLQDIPKTDLHVHLDGSLRLKSLIELAQEQKVELPSFVESELHEGIFSGKFSNLVEYLAGFQYTCAVMRTPDAVERIAYEFACDNYDEGVRYFEVRYAPQLHASVNASDNFGMREVIHAVYRGLEKAKIEWNSTQKRLLDLEGAPEPPPYDYGIIVCALRSFPPGPYYDMLRIVHPDVSDERLSGMASSALVSTAARCRDQDGIPVVAVDIAGAEDGYPNKNHKEAFDLAHELFFNKTAHAGEGFGPESINQAIRDLHAERIGHGFHLFSTDMVSDRVRHKDPEDFINKLVKFISDRRICLEVCPTSNLGTMPGLVLRDHPVGRMIQAGVCVSINTDNRLVSQTTTCLELRKTVETFNLTPKQLKEIVINGFKRSFFHGPYPEKRKYSRKQMDFYDAVAKKHDIEGRYAAHLSGQAYESSEKTELDSK